MRTRTRTRMKGAPRRTSRRRLRQARGRRVRHRAMRFKSRSAIRRKRRRLAAGSPISLLERTAYQAGMAQAAAVQQDQRTREHLITSFRDWHRQFGHGGQSLSRLWASANAYSKGYSAVPGTAGSVIPLPLDKSASAIVTVCDEEKTVSAVLAELEKLPFREIIVVLNGCTDGSFAEARKHKNTILLHYPERLGHDVGRAIGAAAAVGDILLFMDGDLVVPAEQLAAFLYAVDKGTDVALNDISPWLPAFQGQDSVTRSKAFLNLVLGRPDLKSNSLTAIPHALSRRSITRLGTAVLAVPPKALALAVLSGLKISTVAKINVIKSNRIRKGNTGEGNAVGKLILGDHIEALGEAMKRSGVRLGLTSQPRAELAKARNSG
ncbi:glycosyltransferase family A protein [Paenibacillus sp. J22TS3]|uniref:glycosyltransferase family 2 protein n=1 Tax=Paenibacillus sp. J22TS3 TaxID=2807192 RepID=UPI001B2F5B59|nr:glycosyltransferase family A protein [Paenibacillus sp. J22TS3]GIP24102.1 hypothetical protein J22TS3_43770 [Paenibacillus sp. J22TS3]